jgi:hypothetical protein
LIKIITAASKRDLEEIANALSAEGFRMTILAFRGSEPWAVFEKQDAEVLDDKFIDASKEVFRGSIPGARVPDFKRKGGR